MACATGAVCEATRSSAKHSSRRPVCGEARLCSTGTALVTSGRSVAIVLLRPSPRPARPSPKLFVLTWFAVRVFLSNMLNSWSMSTGSRVWETGIVPPGLERPCARGPFPVPGTSARSPRPTARSPSCRRAAARPSFRASVSTIAVTRPVFGSWCGVSELTTPDARAGDPHLVGRLQAGGLGQLDLDVVGGHERQPVVGVVGEEHGHDHDQRRDRADQQRAGGQGVAPARGSSRRLRGVAAEQSAVGERRGAVGGGLRRRARAAAQLAGLQAFAAPAAGSSGVSVLFAPSWKSGKTGADARVVAVGVVVGG